MDLIELIQKIKSELGLKINAILYEPEPFISELLLEILRSAQLECTYVPSLKELFSTLLKDNFHLVILAIETLDEEVITIIKELKRVNQELLMYAMIDYHKNFDIGNLFTAGADEVIFKPFSVGEFKARLWKLLKEFYLNKKIERFIVEDALTQTYNRRHFEISIREETYRAIRLKYPLSLIMIDLDKFKFYNDNFGHKEGDKVLISVGNVFCKNTRGGVDKVCRYGGDEFVIILPYTTYEVAIKIVERIFEEWDHMPYKPVTLSAGIAQLIDRGELEKSVSDLINRADAAMYKAKKIEGNSYVVDSASINQLRDEESQDGGLLFQL